LVAVALAGVACGGGETPIESTISSLEDMIQESSRRLAERADRRLEYVNDLSIAADGYDAIEILPTYSRSGVSAVIVIFDWSESTEYETHLSTDAIAQEFWSDSSLGSTATVTVGPPRGLPESEDPEFHTFTYRINRAMVGRYMRCHGPQETIYGRERCIRRLILAGQDLYLGI
jgi:hypothetical protein